MSPLFGLTNHTLGGGLKGSLILKALEVGGIASDFKAGKVSDNLYSVFHAVNKRVALRCICSTIPNLTAYWTYGFNIPKALSIDNSIEIRVRACPAGNKKVEIAIALLKYAVNFKVIQAADSYVHATDILKYSEEIMTLGAAAHVGASFYLWKNFNAEDYHYKFFADYKVEEVIRDYGSILSVMSKFNTLNNSPIIQNILKAGINNEAVAKAKGLTEARAKKSFDQMVSIVSAEKATEEDASAVAAIISKLATHTSPKIEPKTKEEFKEVVSPKKEDKKQGK